MHLLYLELIYACTNLSIGKVDIAHCLEYDLASSLNSKV